jgi:hypothetical protein
VVGFVRSRSAFGEPRRLPSTALAIIGTATDVRMKSARFKASIHHYREETSGTRQSKRNPAQAQAISNGPRYLYPSEVNGMWRNRNPARGNVGCNRLDEGTRIRRSEPEKQKQKRRQRLPIQAGS